MATRPRCSPTGSTYGIRTLDQRFILLPLDIVLTYQDRPLVSGVYAGIARLSESAKQAVPVSRADLARWCDASRDDGLGTGCKRAIDDLRNGGYLSQSGGDGRKLHLLPAWGFDRSDQPRRWRFNRPDRARPDGLAFVSIPLILFDAYLGWLTPDSDNPAPIVRYFDMPLLDLTNIGFYAVCQLGTLCPTPRLIHLGLVDEEGVRPPPSLDELLERAANGTLTTIRDGQVVTVRLSAEGERERQRRRTIPSEPSGAPGGDPSVDPSNGCTGSADGSVDSESHKASGRGEAQLIHPENTAWDIHDQNQLTNSDPPSPCCTDAHAEARAGESVVSTGFDWGSEQPTEAQPPQPSNTSAAARENIHPLIPDTLAVLDGLIVMGHEALNVDRVIPAAEWWGLLALQQEHGREMLLTWQLRAAGAGRHEVRLAYYLACAAQAAFGMVGRRRVTPKQREAAPRQREAAVAPRADTPPVTPPPRRAAPAPTAPACALDPSRKLVLEGIERLVGAQARHPEKLAAVPLARLARWRDVAAHPGLRRWSEPLAYIISEAAAGHDPPSQEELNRWAERVVGYWAARGVDEADDDVETWEEHQEFSGAHDFGANGATEEEAMDTDPHAALRAQLCALLPDSELVNWLCDGISVSLLPSGTQIVCHSGAIYAVARDLRGVFRDALSDLGLPDDVEVIGPAAEQPHTTSAMVCDPLAAQVSPPPQAQSVSLPEPDQRGVVDCSLAAEPPPSWIDPARWTHLDDDLRTVLAGSVLAPDGLDVRAEVYDLIRTRFAAPVGELLAAAQVRASP